MKILHLPVALLSALLFLLPMAPMAEAEVMTASWSNITLTEGQTNLDVTGDGPNYVFSWNAATPGYLSITGVAFGDFIGVADFSSQAIILFQPGDVVDNSFPYDSTGNITLPGEGVFYLGTSNPMSQFGWLTLDYSGSAITIVDAHWESEEGIGIEVTPAAASVPEPSVVMAAALGGLLIAGARWRSRRRMA